MVPDVPERIRFGAWFEPLSDILQCLWYPFHLLMSGSAVLFGQHRSMDGIVKVCGRIRGHGHQIPDEVTNRSRERWIGHPLPDRSMMGDAGPTPVESSLIGRIAPHATGSESKVPHPCADDGHGSRWTSSSKKPCARAFKLVGDESMPWSEQGILVPTSSIVHRSGASRASHMSTHRTSRIAHRRCCPNSSPSGRALSR